ncbi:hypothetical protein PIB30_055201 [Stylosanthes scabra]|uniref:Uncharacterized protein n=1 Tax=Stylosanthes scabra TaxID=79078 RepID=A0ABU6QIY8_9FABA|nr:hypothetical protein [Stylosanthes scabra]
MIAPVTEAKVTGSSPIIYDPCGGNTESKQKGGAGYFGVAVTFAREQPCLASPQWEAKLELGRERNRRITRIKALDSDGKISHREKRKRKEGGLVNNAREESE